MVNCEIVTPLSVLYCGSSGELANSCDLLEIKVGFLLLCIYASAMPCHAMQHALIPLDFENRSTGLDID